MKGAFNSVETKSKQLKEYRGTKDRLEEIIKRKDEDVQWSYYDVLDQILGNKPGTVPQSVVNDLALTQSKENTSENPETPEMDESLFGEDSNADETVHLHQPSVQMTSLFK